MGRIAARSAACCWPPGGSFGDRSLAIAAWVGSFWRLHCCWPDSTASIGPHWAAQNLGLFRISAQGLFIITAGIAMAVLVLEAGRARNEDLNEKLRRLSLITAQATQSLRVDKALDGILRHLVESWRKPWAWCFSAMRIRDSPHSIWSPPSASAKITAVRTRAVQLSEPGSSRFFSEKNRYLPATSPKALSCKAASARERSQPELSFACREKTHPWVCWRLVVSSLGSLKATKSHFLVNVANLLGLTVQNIALFESAADSRRQWRDTFDSIDDLILVHSSDGEILRPTGRSPNASNSSPSPSSENKFATFPPWRGPMDPLPLLRRGCGKGGGGGPLVRRLFSGLQLRFHGSEGGRLGTIHVLKDFTSRRLAENKFRNLFERAQEGVFVVSPEGQLLDCNSALVRLYGYESKEELLRAYTPAQILCGYRRPCALGSRSLDEYGQVADFEFQFRRRDGEIRTAHLSAFVTRDEAGSPMPIRVLFSISPSASKPRWRFAGATRNCWR